MKVILSSVGRAAEFDPSRWTSRPVNVPSGMERTGVRDDHSIDLQPAPGEPDPIARRKAVEALFAYRIFPVSRMRALVCAPDRSIVDGVTIIQRVFAGPACIEMAVRVVEVFGVGAQQGKTGFSYATIEGHVERGLATFSIDNRVDGALVFRIESWSLPGNWLARLGRPIARRMQRSSTDEALRHFRDHFRDAPLSPTSRDA